MISSKEDWQKYLAEFIGTFALVFIGCGACIVHHRHSSDITQVGVAIAFGGVVMSMVYSLGHISGAHINPAVTIAFVAVRRFPVAHIAPYLIAQCLGAACASGVHLLTYGLDMAQDAQFGATLPIGANQANAFGLEFILTCFLMFVIMAVATDERVHRSITGLAIGAVVCFDCLAAGKCCGASMNPARSLGPALFAGETALRTLWLYWCAPILGAITAAWIYEYIRGKKDRIAMVPDFGSPGADDQ